MNPKRKPGGRWWLWPFGLAVFAVLLLSVLRWLVQPERLGAFVLQQAETATGLRFAVQGPPRLGIWPRLHLQLQQLEVSDPLLPGVRLASIDQVSLYLPLAALRGEQRIDAISLHRPLIDLRALTQRGASEVGPPAPPWLPEIVELNISDGSLLGDGWSLEALELELGGLMLRSAPLRLDARGILAAGERRLPIAVGIRAENPEAGGPLGWKLDSLSLGDHQTGFLAAHSGQIDMPDWSRPRIELQGSLSTWPSAWPPIPEPLGRQLNQLTVQLHYDPTAVDQALRITAQGSGRSARLAIMPEQVADWLSAGNWLAPLPGQLELSVDRVVHEDIRIEGLRISHGTNDAD